ncbi:MAG: class I SAM-dependent methyltransferase [Candidatus Methanomethylicaceae archaeon]
MSKNTFRLMLKSIVREVLPPGLARVIRWFIKSEGRLRISYELVREWPKSERSSWTASAVTYRFKKAVERFNPNVATQSGIVRDTLEALGTIDLQEATLLDFGCGNGLFRKILATYSKTEKWKYIGADVNPELIEFCRSLYPNTRFELIDEERDLPFSDDEFDVVLASGVIQCVQNYTALLSELRRISRSWVVLSRLPIWKYNQSQIAVQVVYHVGG